METPEPGDLSPWLDIAADSPELRDDAEAMAHVVHRFQGKYLPAWTRAKTPQERERAWTALWHFLTARPTRRKPFALSAQAADELIARLQAEVARRLPPPTG